MASRVNDADRHIEAKTFPFTRGKKTYDPDPKLIKKPKKGKK